MVSSELPSRTTYQIPERSFQVILRPGLKLVQAFLEVKYRLMRFSRQTMSGEHTGD